MELQNPMHTISSSVDADVLTVLARADSEFTISTLERMMESRSYEGIRNSLARLASQGVVTRRSVGRAHAYSLNRQHLAAPAIIELANLPESLRGRIREHIQSWTEKPYYVAMFGSGARGEMQTGSDIDLVFVREHGSTDRWQDQVDSLTRDISTWTGNDVRPLEFAVDDIRGRAMDEPILREIARDAFTIHGELSAFRRLVDAT